jgi:hypothetical protein
LKARPEIRNAVKSFKCPILAGLVSEDVEVRTKYFLELDVNRDGGVSPDGEGVLILGKM